MDRVIVYVDDAAYAQQVLAPFLACEAAVNTRWVLVACAPRMTHRIGKWVSHSARENWRTKWSDKLFGQIVALMPLAGAQVTTVVAKGPLAELTDQLQAGEPSAARVLDARRPKADVRPDSDAPQPRGSSLPGSLGSFLTGCGALWMLALE
jgi:hypothetical protein